MFLEESWKLKQQSEKDEMRWEDWEWVINENKRSFEQQQQQNTDMSTKLWDT